MQQEYRELTGDHLIRPEARLPKAIPFEDAGIVPAGHIRVDCAASQASLHSLLESSFDATFAPLCSASSVHILHILRGETILWLTLNNK